MRHLTSRPLAALFGLLLLVACGDEPPITHELTGTAMGTTFSVQVPGELDDERREELERAVDGAIGRVEQAMSTYLLESEISKFNASRSTSWFPVSAYLCGAVERAIGLSRITDGAFDLTVGPLVNLWGFGPEPDRVQPPDDDDIEAMRARVGHARLHADCSRPALKKDNSGIYVDLSAYAKGMAVDSVAELLAEQGFEDYLVEVGGEVRTRGRNASGDPWAIAVELPDEMARQVSRIFPLSDLAMATSGDYRNFFEYQGRRYSHVIDARSGRPPVHDLAAVTVIAESAAFADAMATALLVLGPQEGMELARREEVAAYLQVRTSRGYDELMTPALEALLGSE